MLAPNQCFAVEWFVNPQVVQAFQSGRDLFLVEALSGRPRSFVLSSSLSLDSLQSVPSISFPRSLALLADSGGCP